MCVALVAAVDAAKVRLVTGVHMHVLLAVGTVGKPAVATVKLTLKRLLT